MGPPDTCIIPADFTPALKDSELEKISRLACQRFGLDLHNGKQGLMAARLGKTLCELGLNSFQQYYDYLRTDRSGAALADLADRLTTNHTSFFREPGHFDFLRKAIFPALRARPRIDIWSAACSSGEEAYSIAMSLLEESPEAVSKVRIRATDISTRMLQKATSATYSAARLAPIPPAMVRRYLLPGQRAEDQRAGAEVWRFKPEVRSMIDFERLNLMETLPQAYRCSVIFCRNIMIYFDTPTQQNLVQRLTQNLEDGGYLFIGHSECLNGVTHGLEYVSPAIYRKPGSLHGAQSGAQNGVLIGHAR